MISISCNNDKHPVTKTFHSISLRLSIMWLNWMSWVRLDSGAVWI